jgi:hypothetical protein
MGSRLALLFLAGFTVLFGVTAAVSMLIATKNGSIAAYNNARAFTFFSLFSLAMAVLCGIILLIR